MNKSIKFSYKDRQHIKQGNRVYSIAQIEWWLMKYYDLFKLVTGTYTTLCDNCKVLEDENLLIDCLAKPGYCNKKVEFKIFIGFYNTLDDITQIHRLSDVCYMAYEDYSFLVCTDEDCTEWTVKHYNLWTQLHYFFYNYIEDEQEFMEIQEIPNTNIQLTINNEDFRIIIAFYNAYYEAYYVKDLYPEKRQEIERKISR